MRDMTNLKIYKVIGKNWEFRKNKKHKIEEKNPWKARQNLEI